MSQAMLSSAAHASSSRHDMPSWTILFAAVVALVVVMAEGFATPGSQDGIVIKIPIDTVVRGAPGTVHVLTITPVAPEDVGRECAVAAEGINNESVHPNSDLLVRSDTGEVVLADVERAPNVRTEVTDTLTVGTEISVAVRLGPDGVFSGGLVVELDCPPLPPPADLKVCKDAGTGVAPDTPFAFLVDGQTLNVPAGSCVVGGRFPQGTTVTVSETIPSGIRVSDIAVDPPDRVVGTPDIAGGRVAVRIELGGTEVRFSNEEVPARDLNVRCLHEPLWPQPGDTVTITAESLNEALAPRLADAIEIWVGEADDPDQTSTNVTSATFSTTVEAPGFIYGCQVRDGGNVGANVAFSGWRRVTVGAPAPRRIEIPLPPPLSPIVIELPAPRALPVVFNGSRANSVDILLIPDRDSYTGAADANFLRDAASVIRNAYYSENIFLFQQRRLNFWLAQDTGVANGFPPPAGQNCSTEPDNFNTEYLFAQSAGILHRRALRDCAQGRLFSGMAQNFRVILHETGHAPFGLADEYCCDGGYSQPDSNPNVYGVFPGVPLPPGQDRVAIGRARCEADAPNVGRGVEQCREITNAWFTSDPPSNDLMVDNQAPQALDLRRINAVFDSCAAGTLAGGC